VPVEPFLVPCPGLSAVQVPAPLLDHQAAEPLHHIVAGLAELDRAQAAHCQSQPYTNNATHRADRPEPGIQLQQSAPEVPNLTGYTLVSLRERSVEAEKRVIVNTCGSGSLGCFGLGLLGGLILGSFDDDR
jgi:hypothetical protein